MFDFVHHLQFPIDLCLLKCCHSLLVKYLEDALFNSIPDEILSESGVEAALKTIEYFLLCVFSLFLDIHEHFY